MRYLKVLGLTAVSVAALMATGTGSASAAHLYSTGVQLSEGTQIVASLESGTTETLSTTDGKTLVNTCTSAEVKAHIHHYIGGVVQTITLKSSGGCTVTTDTLTNGSLETNSSGALTGKGTVVTVNFGGVSCRYGTGAGTTLGTLTTGKMAINAVINEQEPKSFICPDTTKFVANFTVTSPHNLTAGA